MPVDEPAAAWLPPSADLRLDRGEVHVWRVRLDTPPAALPEFAATLSPEEKARAARFKFEAGRQSFLISHGAVRDVLSRLTGVPAALLRFETNACGKPRLVPVANAAQIFFNLAHSHGLALIAVSTEAELGVDVERIRPDFATAEIAARFFAPAEVAKLSSLPAEAQVAAFFACWTRKEAYLKARGDGLSGRLDGFEVAFAPGEPAAILRAEDDAEAAQHWQMIPLDAGANYAAALVVKGKNFVARCWNWP